MTPGQRLIRSLPLKRSFYDAHERRSYLRMMEVGACIIDDDGAIERGRAHLERFARRDSRQADAYRVWTELLRSPPEEIARALLADDDHGATLRDTAPVFVVISADQAKEIWRRSA
ncbi:MAG TPA: hypothetical protein VG248_18490 [Caulobacteraceae bacterium]|jgi:hypothetical protein|nr:hypothetical protein [Caulobacteraceae bacterium]